MSFNEYLQQRFEGTEGTQELVDITNHGLSGGVSGFIYNHELYTLFLDFETEILDYLSVLWGTTLAKLAENASTLDYIARNAVWMYVESWAFEELVDRNHEDLVYA